MAEINQAVVFQAGNEEYAFPIKHVISIEKSEGITPIPHLPPSVRGIIKVRGELIPVIDFEYILYNRFLELDEKTRFIVLQTEKLSLSILVKDAREILDIPTDSLKQISLLGYGKTAYFTGVANLGNRLVTVINPDILVESLDEMDEINEYMVSAHASSSS